MRPGYASSVLAFLFACAEPADDPPLVVAGTAKLTVQYTGEFDTSHGVADVLYLELDADPPGLRCSPLCEAPPSLQCSPLCEATYPVGTTVHLKAPVPQLFRGVAGQRRWGGACTGTQEGCTLTLQADQHVTLEYVLAEFPLTVERANASLGDVFSSPPGIDCGATCTALFKTGYSYEAPFGFPGRPLSLLTRLVPGTSAVWTDGDDFTYGDRGYGFTFSRPRNIKVTFVPQQCRDGLCFVNPTPYTEDLRALHGAAADALWAVGGLGAILFWNGSHWSLQDSGTRADLTAVYALAANDVWAVGGDATGAVAVHYDGARWTVTRFPGLPKLAGVAAAGPGAVWAVGASGTALMHDGGKWSSVDGAGLDDLWSVAARAADDVWLVGGGQGGATTLRWDGARLRRIVQDLRGPLISVIALSQNDAWAVSKNQMSRWDGSRWTLQKPLESGDIDMYRLYALAPDQLYVATRIGLYQWTQGAWKNNSSSSDTPTDLWGTPQSGWLWGVCKDVGICRGDPRGFWAVSSDLFRYSRYPLSDFAVEGSGGRSDNDLWFVGGTGTSYYNGWALHWDGSRWDKFAPPRTLRRVWIDGMSTPWIAGDSGWVLRWNGTGFARVGSPFTAFDFFGLWGSSAKDVWVAGASGALFHYNGVIWLRVNLPTSQTLRGVWGSAADDVWVVGDGGVVLHYDGSAWRVVDSGTSANLVDVWGSGRGDVYAVGAQGEAGVVLRHDGARWQRVDVGIVPALRGVYGRSASQVVVVGKKGMVTRWDGTRWSAAEPVTRRGVRTAFYTPTGHLWLAGEQGMILHGAP